MKIERGHVINARFPHASGMRGKKRPVVVIQSDVLNKRLRHAVVAQLSRIDSTAALPLLQFRVPLARPVSTNGTAGTNPSFHGAQLV